jgi:hypothetical protein
LFIHEFITKKIHIDVGRPSVGTPVNEVQMRLQLVSVSCGKLLERAKSVFFDSACSAEQNVLFCGSDRLRARCTLCKGRNQIQKRKLKETHDCQCLAAARKEGPRDLQSA